MNLCNQLNEQLSKSDLSELSSEILDALKDDDFFEITEVDGKVIVDSDGELESDDAEVYEIAPVENFSELCFEIASDERMDKPSESEIESMVKKFKLSIHRKITVTAWKHGSSELEEYGETELEFDISLYNFKYDKRKDILTAKMK